VQLFPVHRCQEALLGAVSSKTATVTWAGLAPPSWSSRTGKSLDQPRCRRLVDPAGILSQLAGNEREVIASLWDRQGRWWAVLDGIAAGHDIWLDVAERLRPGSDAGSAEDLGMAIGEAFMRAPEKVSGASDLRTSAHTWLRRPERYR